MTQQQNTASTIASVYGNELERVIKRIVENIANGDYIDNVENQPIQVGISPYTPHVNAASSWLPSLESRILSATIQPSQNDLPGNEWLSV